MKKIWIAALSLLTTGCGIYNQYERPDLGRAETDSLYRPEAAPDTSSSIASLRWEELFTAPCLQSLIRRALTSNTDLQTAALRVKEAQTTLTSSKLAYLPSLQLDPQGALSSFDGSKAQKTYTLGGSASWEVDLFGRLTNAKRRARAALLESEAYRQAMQTQVIATVADSYYTLLMLDEQVRVTAQTVESWREYVKALHALMNAGEADRATLSQAEASRLSAESSLLSLQRQVAEQENALCAFIGEVPRHIERSAQDRQQFPAHMSVGVPVELLSRRPDVRQAEAALMQAFYATNSARSAFYPGITLSGSAGWTNNGGAAITNPGAWLLQAVGSLVQPLFNRGQNIQPRTEHRQPEDSQGAAGRSPAGLQAVAPRRRTGGEQRPHPMADGTRTNPPGQRTGEAPGNHRIGHTPADGARHGELPASAHRPPVAPLGPADPGIRPLQRDTGSHQSLPCPGRRHRPIKTNEHNISIYSLHDSGRVVKEWES